MTNNPYFHILKVSLASPSAKNESQSWIFIVKMIKALCCSRLLENPTSSSENINFANGQTNRIQQHEDRVRTLFRDLLFEVSQPLLPDSSMRTIKWIGRPMTSGRSWAGKEKKKTKESFIYL
jgi:hypothetical protein